MSAFFTSFSSSSPAALASETLEAGQRSQNPTGWWNRFWDNYFDFKLEFAILESRPKSCPFKKLARAKLTLVAFNPQLVSNKSLAHLTIVK